MQNKLHYAQQARDKAAIFSHLADDIIGMQAVYFDRGYGSGGGSELIDADVAGAGITAADVTGLVTFAGALDTFLAANRGYLSVLRNDL